MDKDAAIERSAGEGAGAEGARAEAGGGGGRRYSRLWPVAFVLVVFMLLVGLPLAYVLVKAANTPGDLVDRAASGFGKAMAPTFNVQTLTLSTVEQVQRESKLVVLQTTVNVEIEKSESASSWGIYWGTNTARVLARDVRVQYAVDLRGFNTSDVVVDPEKKVMVLTMPRPKLDETMIGIDPTKIETRELSGGWLRWDKGDTHGRAVAELRPKAVTAGQAAYLQEEAERAATESLKKLLRPLQETLAKERYGLEIQFH